MTLFFTFIDTKKRQKDTYISKNIYIFAPQKGAFVP